MSAYILLPPPGPQGGSNTINGTTYAAAQGVGLSVPTQSIAAELAASGWTNLALQGADITANRPINPLRGIPFIDTTLSIVIVWDGLNWRNVLTYAIS